MHSHKTKSCSGPQDSVRTDRFGQGWDFANAVKNTAFHVVTCSFILEHILNFHTCAGSEITPFLRQKQLSTVKWQLLPIKNAFSFVETSELLEAKPQSVSSAAQWILMQLFLEKSLRKAGIRRLHHQVYRPHSLYMLYKVWVLFQKTFTLLVSSKSSFSLFPHLQSLLFPLLWSQNFTPWYF